MLGLTATPNRTHGNWTPMSISISMTSWLQPFDVDLTHSTVGEFSVHTHPAQLIFAIVS